jgi:branched-chain amino acid transport system permease protein
MALSRKLDLTVPVLLTGALVLWFLPDIGLKTYQTETLTRFLIFSIAAMGLNLTLGYAGQINLAQAAFLGVGAYTTAIMTTAGMPWLASVGVGAVLCFLIGIVLGFPALRVQHHYLAFVTLAFGTLMWLVARNEEWLTGGVQGIGRIPRPEFLGVPLKVSVDFHRFVVVMTLLLAILLWWIIRSPWGRAFQALRENPTRASSLGINVRNYTLLAFAIGCMYGGIAGSFYAPLTRFIDHSPFDLGHSLEILLMVIAGGSGYFFGPFLGALLSVVLPELLRFSGGLYLIIYAALVMGLLILSPTGIFGLIDRIITSRKTAAASDARKAATATLDQGAKS